MADQRTIRVRIWAAAGAIAFLFFTFSGPVAAFYTDMLWFQDMGQAGVFWTRLLSSWTYGLGAGLVAFAIVFSNILIARRMRPTLAPAIPFDEQSSDPRVRFEQTVAKVREFAEPYILWVALAVALFIAWGAGAQLAANWEGLRLAMAGVRFGRLDPQFGLDVGFFVFVLPALRLLSGWLTGVLFITLVVTIGTHLLDGAIRLDRGLSRGVAPHVKAHVSVLAGIIVAVQALGYLLAIYELDFSPRGQVTGASYADVHAQLPAYYILMALAVACGIALIVNIRVKGWRLPLIALAVWVGASIVVGGIYPGLVQQFRVTPNELAAEKPYIERNIAETREAFDLAAIDATPFPAANDLTAQDLVEATATISNVRMWDPNVVVDSYKQLQEIRYYYDFNDVDIDRYVVDGVRRQTLVSAREMNVEQLSDQAQTWVNRHLVYTHGYGMVMSPVNEASPDGLPRFIINDIPPKTNSDLKISRPGIYFGEEANEYVIVDTAQKEFDYPSGDSNVSTAYAGDNGVGVGTALRRFAFALRFGDGEILFSDAIRPASRILYRRAITARVGALAPWLSLDRDPYPMLTTDGRMVWILDGFTSTPYYPYSQRYNDERLGAVNYVRNSVKVTVDAYDGTTTFYAFDEKDPVLAAYRRIYPELVRPKADLPADVEAHLRYPEDLFSLQARVYSTYHMLEPQVFYNKEDQWAVPGESQDQAMKPFYVLMAVPGESEQTFQLIEPYTPRNKDNMISWVAAKCDPGVYGQRIVFQFPKQRLILGPMQVQARLNQEPSISSVLTLLDQRGSNVRFGNLLVIPIKDSVVYIEPVYIQAEQSPMPELKYVVVAYGDQVVMEDSLAAALVRVFGAAPRVAEDAMPSTDATATGAGRETTGTTPPRGQASTADDAKRAAELYREATEAQRRGDWAAYGRLMKELGVVLERMARTGAAGAP